MDPLGYVEFMSLVRGAAAIVTDSGGVQEETTLLRVPCLTLRPNTERPITITSGSNRLVTRDELAAAVLKACDDGPYTGELPPLWDGHAGPRIARIITTWLEAAMTDMTPAGAPDGAQGQEMTADAGRPAGAGLSDDAGMAAERERLPASCATPGCSWP